MTVMTLDTKVGAILGLVVVAESRGWVQVGGSDDDLLQSGYRFTDEGAEMARDMNLDPLAEGSLVSFLFAVLDIMEEVAVQDGGRLSAGMQELRDFVEAGRTT